MRAFSAPSSCKKLSYTSLTVGAAGAAASSACAGLGCGLLLRHIGKVRGAPVNRRAVSGERYMPSQLAHLQKAPHIRQHGLFRAAGGSRQPR